MKHTNLWREIGHKKSDDIIDTTTFLFLVLGGIVAALIISDFIFGAERVTNFIAGVWLRLF